MQTAQPAPRSVLDLAAEPRRANEQRMQMAQMAPAMGQNAVNLFGAYSQPSAQMFGTLGGIYGQGMGALGGMYNSYVNAFGNAASAVGNMFGNAQLSDANQNAGRYAAYAGGLDAHGRMMGNLGSSALAAYGNASTAAMQSHAARETAAMKAMADMVAANQAAAAQYGVGRDQALAGTAGAYGNAASQGAAGRAMLGNAAANLGGAGSSALANLASTTASAAGNASTGAAAGQAQLSAADAAALSAQAAAQQNALAQNASASQNAIAGLTGAGTNAAASLGSSAAQLGLGLGQSRTSAAGTNRHHTRGMAKLDVARQLGLANANVASQGLGNLNFGFQSGGGSPNFSIYGPDGQLASGWGGFGGGQAMGGSGGGSIFMDPNANQPFYSQRQEADGGGNAMLGGLQDRAFGELDSLAADARGATARGLNQSGAQAVGGAQDISAAGTAARQQMAANFNAGTANIATGLQNALGLIGSEGAAGRAGILGTLSDNGRVIAGQGAGLDQDMRQALGGIDASRAAIENSGVLGSLNDNYRSGMGTLDAAYQSGRQDPRTLLSDVLAGTQSLLSPLVSSGQNVYDQWMRGFPEPLPSQQGGSLTWPMMGDLIPQLSAAFDPMGQALAAQSNNVMAMMMGGRGDHAGAQGTLRGAYDNAAAGLAGMYGDTIGRALQGESQPILSSMPINIFGGSQARMPDRYSSVLQGALAR